MQTCIEDEILVHKSAFPRATRPSGVHRSNRDLEVELQNTGPTFTSISMQFYYYLVMAVQRVGLWSFVFVALGIKLFTDSLDRKSVV